MSVELSLGGGGSFPFRGGRDETLAGEFGGEFQGEGVGSCVRPGLGRLWQCLSGKGAGCAARGGSDGDGWDIGCLDCWEP